MQMLIYALLCLHYSMDCRSTTYRKKKKAREELAPDAPPFTFYHTEVVNKCYIDKVALRNAHAYVLRMKFNDDDDVATIAIKIPSLVFHMQITEPCMRIFFLTRLHNFFNLKPIQIDAQRVHQFLTSIQEDGTCKMIGPDGATTSVRIDSDMVTQALKFFPGDHNVSSMKLSLEEKKKVFKMQDDSVTKMVYNNLMDQGVKLPLQLY